MLKIIDCARMSKHVYNIEKRLLHFNPTPLNEKNIQSKRAMNGFGVITDVSPTMHPRNHFYAALYLKFVAMLKSKKIGIN